MSKHVVLHLYKVGGSLLRTQQHLAVMQRVMAHSLAAGEVPIFLMGGGALADAVRELCKLQHASVQAEHAMSLLAMQQNAILVASQLPVLKHFSSVKQAFELFHTYTPGIWLSLVHNNVGEILETSNSITSDSITLYLAQVLCLHARAIDKACEIRVTLLKSCEVPDELSHNAPALAKLQIVDDAFPEFALRLEPYANAAWRVVNAQASFMAART